MNGHRTVAALFATTTLVACAASPSDSELAAVVRKALADASSRSAAPSPPEVVQAERVVWRDGSLGCPQPDRMYTQALVPGYRVLVRTRSGLLHYHAGLRGEPLRCPRERAVDPLPESARR